MYIVKYDYEDLDGNTTFGIEVEASCFSEACDIRDNLLEQEGAKQIQIIGMEC